MGFYQLFRTSVLRRTFLRERGNIALYGSVYTKKIERNELEDYEDKYKISNLSYIKDELMIRYIAKESHEGMTVYPDLEEVYLYYCGDAYGKK